jgi:hypothetical protein
MSGASRLRRLLQVLAMSLIGPSRHFVAAQQFSRFRSEADIRPAALAEPDL